MTKQAQQWLDTKYNNKQSGDSIKLLTSEELSGEIKIENYANTKEIILVRLEKGSLSKGKISKVTIRNCQEVERVLLGRNEITEIVFDGDFPKLTHLGARDNQLSKIDLSKVSNLEILNIAGNPIGSQEIEKAIKGLTKLKFVNTPGFSLKNIADDHADWINPDDIKNALGVKPTDPLPDDWKKKLDDLKKRPTQEDLNNAVKTAEKNVENKYKDYINPKDSAGKAKLEQAAKNIGFIDPKDNNALKQAAKTAGLGFSQKDIDNAIQTEKNNWKGFINPNNKPAVEAAAKGQGMVSKADYDKVVKERNDRPNITINDYQKLLVNQKPADYDAIKNELNKIKTLLGIPPASPLPGNLGDQLAKKSDLVAARDALNKWTNKFPGKNPDQVAAQSRPAPGTAVLTPEQQQKLNNYDRVVAERDARANISAVDYAKIEKWLELNQTDWKAQILHHQ
jgi:hypothetical protein